MRDETQAPEGAPLPEEIFQLNLSYLMLAQRLLAQDEQRAAIALGVREPLTSWLREASASADRGAGALPGRGPRAAVAEEGGRERARRLQRGTVARPRPCGHDGRRGDP